MTAVFINILLPLLAIVTLLAAFFYLLKALGQRRRINRQVYSVGQVEMRRAMKIGFLRAIVIAFAAALLLFAWGVMRATGTWPLLPEPTPMPTVAPTNTPTPTLSPDVTPAPAETMSLTLTPGAMETTVATPTATATATPTPTVTPTPPPATAVVSSGVGVWLRAAPSTGGEQLEWLLDETVLTLLPGYETGSDFDWQQVRAPSGREGWVAVPFIRYLTPEQ